MRVKIRWGKKCLPTGCLVFGPRAEFLAFPSLIALSLVKPVGDGDRRLGSSVGVGGWQSAEWPEEAE